MLIVTAKHEQEKSHTHSQAHTASTFLAVVLVRLSRQNRHCVVCLPSVCCTTQNRTELHNTTTTNQGVINSLQSKLTRSFISPACLPASLSQPQLCQCQWQPNIIKRSSVVKRRQRQPRERGKKHVKWWAAPTQDSGEKCTLSKWEKMCILAIIFFMPHTCLILLPGGAPPSFLGKRCIEANQQCHQHCFETLMAGKKTHWQSAQELQTYSTLGPICLNLHCPACTLLAQTLPGLPPFFRFIITDTSFSKLAIYKLMHLEGGFYGQPPPILWWPVWLCVCVCVLWQRHFPFENQSVCRLCILSAFCMSTMNWTTNSACTAEPI